jgi:hypothetical protein
MHFHWKLSARERKGVMGGECSEKDWGREDQRQGLEQYVLKRGSPIVLMHVYLATSQVLRSQASLGI